MNEWILYIIKGTFLTIQYSLLSVFFGIIIGILIATLRLSNNIFLSNIARIYISIIRGTPVLLQLTFVYYVVPHALNIEISAYAAGIFAFSINSSAYVAEIIRGGILSIDKGQFEAAQALCIPKYLALKDIILPQVIKNIFPALTNEVINLVKESAIIGIIGEADIMRRAQIVAAEKYTFFEPLIVAGVCYYIVILCLSFVSSIVEKKLNDKY